MLFYTLPYLLFFLPLSLILFFNREYFKLDIKIILISMSIFFYSSWNIYYLPVIISSILINFYCYKKLVETKINKKKILRLGILLNIFILIVFKYTDFIIQIINSALSTDIKLLNLFLKCLVIYNSLLDDLKGVFQSP